MLKRGNKIWRHFLSTDLQPLVLLIPSLFSLPPCYFPTLSSLRLDLLSWLTLFLQFTLPLSILLNVFILAYSFSPSLFLFWLIYSLFPSFLTLSTYPLIYKISLSLRNFDSLSRRHSYSLSPSLFISIWLSFSCFLTSQYFPQFASSSIVLTFCRYRRPRTLSPGLSRSFRGRKETRRTDRCSGKGCRRKEPKETEENDEKVRFLGGGRKTDEIFGKFLSRNNKRPRKVLPFPVVGRRRLPPVTNSSIDRFEEQKLARLLSWKSQL